MFAVQGRWMNRRQLAAAIRDILMSDWDPIGVRIFAGAAIDEYDDYVPKIVSLMSADASIAGIADYLVGVEAKRMGLVPDTGRANRVAQRCLKVLDQGR